MTNDARLSADPGPVSRIRPAPDSELRSDAGLLHQLARLERSLTGPGRGAGPGVLHQLARTCGEVTLRQELAQRA